MAKKCFPIHLYVFKSIIIGMFLLFIQINLLLIIGFIIIINSINILIYINQIKRYKKSQFFTIYQLPYGQLCTKNPLYKTYTVYTTLLDLYADHCELFIHVSPDKTANKIPILLLHNNGLFAFLYTNIPKKNLNHIEQITKQKIYCLRITKNTSKETIEQHINTLPKHFTQLTLHKIYDIIDLHTNEYVL